MYNRSAIKEALSLRLGQPGDVSWKVADYLTTMHAPATYTMIIQHAVLLLIGMPLLQFP